MTNELPFIFANWTARRWFHSLAKLRPALHADKVFHRFRTLHCLPTRSVRLIWSAFDTNAATLIPQKMTGLPRSLFVGGENLRKAPDFVKGVVQRRRRDADHVRLAKIAFHAGGDELFV